MDCPFCGFDASEYGEEALRVHCLWKHPIEYVTRKRSEKDTVRLAEVSSELDRALNTVPSPPSPKRKKTQLESKPPEPGRRRDSHHRRRLPDKRPRSPSVKCSHNLLPCRDFPFCKFGKNCSFLHPSCSAPSDCTFRHCPFEHDLDKKKCGLCRDQNNAPPKSQFYLSCPHYDEIKFCGDLTGCRKSACKLRHSICGKSGCDKKCGRDHFGFCFDCRLRTQIWKDSSSK